jgi:ketosteroid isomerase-like protein
MVRTLLLMVLLAACSPIRAEEIILETCDRLPVIEVRISGMKFMFLVDTAAVSTLNLKSFPHGDPTKANVSSWSGTVEADAQDVIVGDLAIGQHHFRRLRLMSVDLSAIGRTCGRRIDGILGVDLLSRLGATLDLKTRPARLLVDLENDQGRIAELHAQLVACEQAFNRADEPALTECFDPGIVLFASGGDFYGRDAAMEYYRTRYFQHRPPAHLVITPRAHHPIGEAIWVEYDIRITMGDRIVQARGTALCRKTDGRWRIVHMNHSNTAGDPLEAEKQP